MYMHVNDEAQNFNHSLKIDTCVLRQVYFLVKLVVKYFEVYSVRLDLLSFYTFLHEAVKNCTHR